ncbi:pantetheine-phosphate adenylyltransferase [Bacteroidales bacterium OttesenSCG-928-B11]|nr:pantetheine-phosphate adenylyltransferase [Bacteroidales bacterium OttesenSCG-928-B11]MDL2326680.1 pantetheine-phosphate adenylyltransferase [Bacteroidales bacterium OttesenSCG-928-A14]
MKIAVFPGSFDPITKGHENIIRRIASLFDVVYIAIGKNSVKKSLFPLEKRLLWIESVAKQFANVQTITYNGLTVDLCEKIDAKYIIRGIRNEADFRYENDIAQTNRILAPTIETIFLTTAPELSFISSSIVRDIYTHNGNYQQFLPDIINEWK